MAGRDRAGPVRLASEGDQESDWLVSLPDDNAESCTAPGGARLEVGKKVMISLDPPISQLLLKMPGKGRPIITGMEVGAPMMIVAGPACLDGYIYWQVMTEEGLIGWTAEGDRETLWLVDPIPGAAVACVNSPAPQLAVGRRGAVTNDTDLNSRMRSEPGRQGRALGELPPPGTSFTILEGPTCGDGYYW